MWYMSTKLSSVENIQILAFELYERYEAGSPVTLEGNNARAKFLVRSLDPLAYETYGRFRNKSPKLVGRCAVESLIWTPQSNDLVVPYAVVPIDQGIRLGMHLPAPVLNELFSIVGLPVDLKG